MGTGRGRRRALRPGLDSPPHQRYMWGAMAHSPQAPLPRPAVVGLTAEDAPSLGSYLGSWLAHVKGRVRARTYQGYECLIRLYVMPHLSDVSLAELRPLQLQELYAWL